MVSGKKSGNYLFGERKNILLFSKIHASLGYENYAIFAIYQSHTMTNIVAFYIPQHVFLSGKNMLLSITGVFSRFQNYGTKYYKQKQEIFSTLTLLF